MSNLSQIKADSNWGDASNTINTNFQNMDVELEKLKNSTTKFKGYFTSESNLKNKFPSPKRGDIAFVGEPYPGNVYDVLTDGSWHNTTKAPETGNVDLQDYVTLDDFEASLQEQDDKLTELYFKQKTLNVDYSEYNLSFNLEGFYDKKGAITVFSSWKRTDKLTIPDGVKSFSCACYGWSGGLVIAFFDESDNFISGFDNTNQQSTKNYTAVSGLIPSNAKKFGCSSFDGLPGYLYFSAKESIDYAINLINKLQIDITNIKDLFFSSDIDYNNITDSVSKESKNFGLAFTELNNCFLHIKRIKYKSLNTVTGNRLVIGRINEIDDSKMDITQVIPIKDSVIGENEIDVDIYIFKNDVLYIKANDIYTTNTGAIDGVKQIYSCDISNVEVGKQYSFSQKLSYLKNIQLTGTKCTLSDKEAIKQEVKESAVQNYIGGKVLCVTGDSEAAGHTIGRDNTYGALIANRNNMKLYNTAVNGRKLAYVEGNPGNGTPLVQAIDEIREDADYILCHIGYNDTFEEEVEDDSHDITKYKGAFNTVIEGWQSKRPKARIGIIIPYYFSFSSDDKRVARAEWMKKRCEYYHIQYIDGTIKSGLNYTSSGQKEIYFLDIVHLTALGHERVSYLYEQFMRGL